MVTKAYIYQFLQCKNKTVKIAHSMVSAVAKYTKAWFKCHDAGCGYMHTDVMWSFIKLKAGNQQMVEISWNL